MNGKIIVVFKHWDKQFPPALVQTLPPVGDIVTIAHDGKKADYKILKINHAIDFAKLEHAITIDIHEYQYDTR